MKASSDFSLKLKLLLIKHGGCTACAARPRVKYCGRCFNTRLEPGVLEAITALDLGAKFETAGATRVSGGGALSCASQTRGQSGLGLAAEPWIKDDYCNPPAGSYFWYVLDRKRTLESLYDELLRAPAGTPREAEAMERLMKAALCA